MGNKPLTPEQRKAKTEREKARRARLKAEKSETPKPTKEPKAKKDKAPKAEPPRGKEVDLSRVAPDKAKGMLVKVHKLEKAVEKAAAKLAVASQERRAARANLEKAQEALQREIQEQRYGPGPLFADAGNPDVESEGEDERASA